MWFGIVFFVAVKAVGVLLLVRDEKKEREYKRIEYTKVITMNRRDYTTATRNGYYYETTFMLYFPDGSHKAVTVRNDSLMYDQYMSKLKESA